MIRKNRFNDERKLIRSIFTQNKNSTNIQRAISLIKNILGILERGPDEVAKKIYSKQVRDHARRLLFNADPKDILIEICAMDLYLDRNRLNLPMNADIRRLELTCVGHAMLRTCPMSPMRMPTANTAFAFANEVYGSHLRKFIEILKRTIRESEDEEQELINDLTQPLTYNRRN